VTTGWTETTLGALCESKGGRIQTGPFGSSLHQSDYTDEGIPVVMPKDITGMGIDTSSIARIAPETFTRLSKHKLELNDIVFPRRGEITKCALITKEYEGFLCGTGCLKISIPKQEIWPIYFRYLLALPQSIDWLDSNAVGATMKNLSAGILEKFPLRYPSPPIQIKIAGVLSAYDDLIEANLTRIKLLEEMVQITYEEWFVRLRFPGHETIPINVEVGLPEGWALANINTLFRIKYGQNLPATKITKEIFGYSTLPASYRCRLSPVA
jgi:type I restriction enzyme, S subunit